MVKPQTSDYSRLLTSLYKIEFSLRKIIKIKLKIKNPPTQRRKWGGLLCIALLQLGTDRGEKEATEIPLFQTVGGENNLYNKKPHLSDYPMRLLNSPTIFMSKTLLNYIYREIIELIKFSTFFCSISQMKLYAPQTAQPVQR